MDAADCYRASVAGRARAEEDERRIRASGLRAQESNQAQRSDPSLLRE